MTSALMKTDASFLVSTSLSVSDSNQTRGLIADHRSTPPSFNNVKKRRLGIPIGDVDDRSQTTLITDIISPSTQKAHVHEMTVEPSNLEETGDVRQRDNLEEAENSNREGTGFRNYPKDFAESDSDETGQRHDLEGTEQKSNLTEDEIFSNKIMTGWFSF